MGAVIVSHGAAAPWHSRVVPPVTRGLVGWFTFDTDIRRLPLNRVPGRASAKVVGTPSVFATHARFKGGQDYIDTDISETDQMTIFAVCRTPTAPTGPTVADASMYVGSYQGPAATPGYTGTAFGVNLYSMALDPTVLVGAAARDNGSGGATSGQTQVSDDSTAWGLRVVRVSTQTRVSNLTTGATNTQQSSARRVLTANPLRIGWCHNNAGFTGASDISQLAIYAAALTDDEVAQVAATIRARTERLGLSV